VRKFPVDQAGSVSSGHAGEALEQSAFLLLIAPLDNLLSGIHFGDGDLDARTAGRLVAQQAWAKAQTYFNGTAQED